MGESMSECTRVRFHIGEDSRLDDVRRFIETYNFEIRVTEDSEPLFSLPLFQLPLLPPLFGGFSNYLRGEIVPDGQLWLAKSEACEHWPFVPAHQLRFSVFLSEYRQTYAHEFNPGKAYHKLQFRIDRDCPVEFCRQRCPILNQGDEVERGSGEALCRQCNKPIGNHRKWAYPSGARHVYQDCEGRFIHT
jgi:hypothetical protein